jgi:hypothetical protein
MAPARNLRNHDIPGATRLTSAKSTLSAPLENTSVARRPFQNSGRCRTVSGSQYGALWLCVGYVHHGAAVRVDEYFHILPGPFFAFLFPARIGDTLMLPKKRFGKRAILSPADMLTIF